MKGCDKTLLSCAAHNANNFVGARSQCLKGQTRFSLIHYTPHRRLDHVETIFKLPQLNDATGAVCAHQLDGSDRHTMALRAGLLVLRTKLLWRDA